MKTKWNLKLFYKSPQDTQIEKDFNKTAQLVRSFRRTYASSNLEDLLKSYRKLNSALQSYSKVAEDLSSAKPLMYFYYLNSLNSSNLLFQAKLNDFINRYAALQNELLFFTNFLKKIPAKKQSNILKSPYLHNFYYFLKIIFREGKHTLEEKAEKVLNLKYLPSHFLWVQMNEKNVNKQSIKFKSETLPLNEAINIEKNLSFSERRRLHMIINKKFESLADVSEAELNAILFNKKIDDSLRGFKNVYDSRLLSDQIEEKTLLALENAVVKNYKISHEFYRLKKRLLKLPHLKYEDRAVGLKIKNEQINFFQATKVLQNLYEDLGENYHDIFNAFLKAGQIDVYPFQSKRGGAFCSSSFKNPTMVLLNHTDDLNSLFTLAHEMGHALHAEYSRMQPVFYQEPVISLAETASTLFENLLYDFLLQRADKKEKIKLLHERLNSSMATVFRQMAFFEFEKDLHNLFRAKGSLGKDEIADLFLEHLNSYLGPAFKLDKLDGYSFSAISHFRNFFYVYNYAFGHLVSRYMAEKLKYNKEYIKKISFFLSAGSSDSPKNILKKIGININSAQVWEKSLEFISHDLKELKHLING